MTRRRATVRLLPRDVALVMLLLLVPLQPGASAVSDPSSDSTSRSPEWSRLHPPILPGPHSGHTLTYIGTKFGGGPEMAMVTGNWTQSNVETWHYSLPSNVWTQVATGTAPSSRTWHQSAFAESTGKLILFGGNLTGPPPRADDTWEYDPANRTWTELKPTVRPPPRGRSSMAYDPSTGKIVLFSGGSDTANPNFPYRDTWVFDPISGNWMNATSGAQPPARWGHRMGYDSSLRKVLLAGGFGEGEMGTWAFDSSTNIWTDLKTPGAPSDRMEFAFAYYGTINRAVLYGGWSRGTMETLDETWFYDSIANRWEKAPLTIDPGPRHSPAMDYDPVTDRIILSGGSSFTGQSNETWQFGYGVPSGGVPAIISTSPADGAGDVPLTADLVVEFNVTMEPVATVDSLEVVPVLAASTVTVSGGRLVWKHSQPFAEKTFYTATVTARAKSATGEALPQPYQFRFTTAETPTYLLSGTVTDEGGEPVSGAKVEALLQPDPVVKAAATTATDGRYSFRLPPGSYTIRVTFPDGSKVESGPVSLESDRVVDVNLRTPASPLASPWLWVGMGVFGTLAGLGAALAIGGEAAKLAILLAPVALYSRIRKDRVLDHFTRGQIYGRICESPGKTFGELLTALGVGNGTMSHHIYVLERAKLIRSEREGKFTRFYSIGGSTNKTGVLMSQVQRAILAEVSKEPGRKVSEIAARMKMRKDSFIYNIRQLVLLGIVRIEGWGLEKRVFPGELAGESDSGGGKLSE